MDQARVAEVRMTLESKSADELRQLESSGTAEEIEAARQIIADRRRASGKFMLAQILASALALVGIGLGMTQGFSAEMILLTAIGCAILGFASVYVPNLFGQP